MVSVPSDSCVAVSLVPPQAVRLTAIAAAARVTAARLRRFLVFFGKSALSIR
jgi:hypothetical protein